MKDILTVAAIRGVMLAIATGGLAALAMWSQTDSVKLILIAGLTPALTVLAARLGGEGAYDAAKPTPAPGDTTISVNPPLG